jgi:hypothetical protein
MKIYVYVRTKEATYKAETYPSGEQVTILQLQGSTELISQFSRTLYGSSRAVFMATKATTAQFSIETSSKNQHYELLHK